MFTREANAVTHLTDESLPSTAGQRLTRKLDALVARLAGDFAGKQAGHCVRVDHLSAEEGALACQALRRRLSAAGMSESVATYVLSDDLSDELHIPADRAIEIRNRKHTSLCLFVPASVKDVAVSSLGNSFSPFDLPLFLRDLVARLRNDVPEDLKDAVGAVLRQLRGSARVTAEEMIDYLSAILDDPTERTAGVNLWRVGLIPDLLPNLSEFARRVDLNRQCVDRLARPARAYAGVAERVASLKLSPGTIQADLTRYLMGERLQSDREWLRQLLDTEWHGKLTFECWQFPTVEQSDLEQIEVAPFYTGDTLRPGCGLAQDAPGVMPYARCGPQKAVVVKWQCTPARPTDVAQWRIEMVPDRDKYDVAGVGTADLPQITVRGSARTAKLSLDIDPSAIEVPEVQVRVIALDANGTEVQQTGDGEAVVEGLSQSFYLEPPDGAESDGEAVRQRRLPTERSLPDALLKNALIAKEQPAGVTPRDPEPKDLIYFPFLVGDRTIVRVATTDFLRNLQTDVLQTAPLGGRYRTVARGADTLSRDNLESLPVQVRDESLRPAWEKFVRERKQVFNQIASQKQRGLVEIAELTEALCRGVRSYAKAYCELIDAAVDLAEKEPGQGAGEAIRDLLGLDTLTIELQYLAGNPRATVFLPTHPLRLLWYTAYAEWVNKIAEELWQLPAAERAARFNPKALSQLAPFNIPPLKITEGSGGQPETEVFADNLGFLYAVTLPIETRDPGALLSEVARALGFDELAPSLTDLHPEDVAKEVQHYLGLHRYLQTLRVNVVNPGSGEFVHAALEHALARSPAEEDEENGRDLRLDLITHAAGDVQAPASGLEALNADWYRRGGRYRGNHLQPGIQVARRVLSAENLDSLPGGDVHLSFCLDSYRPGVALSGPWAPGESSGGELNPHHESEQDEAAARGESSASIFGLLTHFQTRFTSQGGIATWERKIAFENDRAVERHPVNRAYSDLLIEAQEAYLRLAALVLRDAMPSQHRSWCKGALPALRLVVGPEERRLVSTLHQQSDWVLTVDRHFGVEYFDTFSDPSPAAPANQYLLDYTPEFVDGVGHRLVVTTRWQEEVTEILGGAMEELGLSRDPASCSALLSMLKMISGRLALRLVGDDPGGEVGQDTLAKETVSLAVVANFLLRKGELENAILIPLDAHRRLFLDAKAALATGSGSRCDLLIVRPTRNRLMVDYVEVKYRQGVDPITGNLLDQIADQTFKTDAVVRGLYFSDPQRLDAPILRCQFAAILRFYAERARRHGRVSENGAFAELRENIARVEMGLTRLVPRYRGFVVNLNGKSQKPIKHGDLTVQVLTGLEIERDTSFYRHPLPDRGTDSKVSTPEREATTAVATEATQAGDNSPHARTPSPQPIGTPHAEQAPRGSATPASGPSGDRNAQNGDRDDGQAAVEIPGGANSPDIEVPLGVSDHTGEQVSWVGSVSGSPHVFVMGIPGQGKSWTVLRLIAEVARLGVPSLVLDFHGQFARPDTAFATAARPQVLAVSEGLPFSPFEVSPDETSGSGIGQWKINAFEVSEILQYVCDLGEMQRDLVYEAIHDAYVEQGFGRDEGEILPLPTVSQVFARLKRLECERKGINNAVARVRPVFDFNLFRESALTIDANSMYSRTTVIDLHGVRMETLQMAAGAFVLRKLYKDMFQWGETDRLRLLVVLDEAHRLARDITLPKLMKEGRKFGVAVVVASQTMQDFHPEVLQNAGTKLLYRTNFPQSKRVIGYLKAPHYIPDLATRLENLGVGHALVQTPEMACCAEVSMHPYRGDLSRSSAERVAALRSA